MFKKIIIWPFVYIFKFILVTIEFILWTPFELLGLTNPRTRYVVKLRSTKPNTTKVKIYKPWGFVGLADKYFIKQRVDYNDYMYYSKESIVNLYECNIKVDQDERVFTVPKLVLEGTFNRRELKKKSSIVEGELDWIFVRDMYKKQDPKIIKDVIVREVVKEVIKKVPVVLQEEEYAGEVIININQPVNKMTIPSLNALLEEIGIFGHENLTIGEKIQLIRTTKLKTSRIIKKLEDNTYYNSNTNFKILENISEKLLIKIDEGTTSSKVRKMINDKAKLIKKIKFN